MERAAPRHSGMSVENQHAHSYPPLSAVCYLMLLHFLGTAVFCLMPYQLRVLQAVAMERAAPRHSGMSVENQHAHSYPPLSAVCYLMLLHFLGIAVFWLMPYQLRVLQAVAMERAAPRHSGMSVENQPYPCAQFPCGSVTASDQHLIY
jgi:hypothetical protein